MRNNAWFNKARCNKKWGSVARWNSAWAAVPLAAAIALTPAAASAQAAAAPIVGNPEAARNKISMCIGCHEIPGYKASFPVVYSVPMIYGQNAKYIQNALEAYRKGDRDHPTMRGIAGSLSDQDIADLAAYYGKSGSPKTAAK